MIELAAKHGDELNVACDFSPEQTEAIFTQLSRFAEKHGRKPESVAKSVGIWTRILRSENEMEEKIKKGAVARGVSEEAYRKRLASSIWGTPDIVAEKVGQYKDQGVSEVILIFPYGEKREQIAMLGESVLPRL
ncbi:MAG: LLM class flavin-dependent oxidoreductase [Candidatus Thorarchaeota archaeon]